MAQNVTIDVPYDQAAFSGKPVLLLLEGLERGRESSALRIFLEKPDADAQTPLEDNPRYAGTIYLYGHGQADPSAERFPQRAARQRLPYDQFLDVTELLQNLPISGDEVKITLVPVDLQDNPVSTDLLKFRRLVLVSRQ